MLNVHSLRSLLLCIEDFKPGFQTAILTRAHNIRSNLTSSFNSFQMMNVPDNDLAPSMAQSCSFRKAVFSSNIATKAKFSFSSNSCMVVRAALYICVCYFYPSVRFALARFSKVYTINLIMSARQVSSGCICLRPVPPETNSGV